MRPPLLSVSVTVAPSMATPPEATVAPDAAHGDVEVGRARAPSPPSTVLVEGQGERRPVHLGTLELQAAPATQVTGRLENSAISLPARSRRGFSRLP